MNDPDARIEAALARLGADYEPPPGWQARVLAATGAPRRRPWWWVVLPVVALAAGGLALVLSIGSPAPAPRPVVAAFRSTPPDGVALRGPALCLHSVLHARASGGAGYRALWIYRDEELVLMCPGAASCHTELDAMVASLTVTRLGVYTVVALSGPVPVFPSTGSYDADVARAVDLKAITDTAAEPEN